MPQISKNFLQKLYPGYRERNKLMLPLSHFEKRLCRLKTSGLSMKEIAELTGLANGTVRNYFSAIYKKISRREYDMSLIREASQNQQALRDQ